MPAVMGIYISAFLLLAQLFSSSVLASEYLSLQTIKKIGDDWLVKIDLPRNLDYSVFTLTHPDRIVIDILNERMKPKQCRLKNYPVIRCRTGRLDGRRARFVLDVAEPMWVKATYLKTKKHKRKSYDQLKIVFTKVEQKSSSQKKIVKKIQPIEPIISRPKNHYVIVIDPGHGGADDLGSSHAAMHEKDLMLAYAKILKKKLSQNPKFRVYLTRERDEYVSLRDRVLMSRSLHADMIISLHADWNADSRVKGFAVYSLSNISADKYTRRFIESDAPEMIGGEDWQNGLDSAHDILFDLVQRETLGKSIALSRNILKRVRRFTPILDQPHRFADLHLLSAPDIPAVLIELGFLSSPQDRKKLRSPKWKGLTSQQIAQGIKAYLQQIARLQ